MKSIITFLAITFLSSGSAQAQDQPYVVLGKIDSDQAQDLSVVTIRLDKNPPWKKVYVDEHGEFLQISLPNTIVSEPGKFIDGKGPYLAKITAYQVQPDKAMIRIFVKEKASAILKATEAEILDNRIVVTIDHKSLAPLETKLNTIDQSAPISKTDKKVMSPEYKKGALSPTNDYQNLLQQFAIMVVFLTLIILGWLTIKRIIRNRQFASGQMDTIKMKAIGHLALAPKQKLSLVQIGSEKFLLSVSSDSIAFLAKINNDRIQPAIATSSSISADDFEQRAYKMQQHVQKAMAEKQIIQQKLKPSTPRPLIETKKTKNAPNSNQEVKKSQPKHKNTSNKSAINYRIDDNGITDTAELTEEKTEETIKDVTQLIREKLKSLPKL